jgi:lipopolysaccharide biosynthesis glycosyltransferase
MKYNILIGCDQKYYDDWGVQLLSSIHKHSPDISLHCHIVNPTKENNLPYVDITSEQIDFLSDEVKISYLQSSRFLVVADKFKNNENVITLDADSICTKPITEEELSSVFERQYVLKHHKEDRWLAGLVTFSDNGFRQEYVKELNSINLENWKWGRDQLILNQMSRSFNFTPVGSNWMSIGKNKNNSIFLTLKGEQKETDKYLSWYKRYLEE